MGIIFGILMLGFGGLLLYTTTPCPTDETEKEDETPQEPKI